MSSNTIQYFGRFSESSNIPAVSETSTIASPELTSLESSGEATAFNYISLHHFKGYPKAGPRKNNKKVGVEGKNDCN
jgi:hypothetical protein